MKLKIFLFFLLALILLVGIKTSFAQENRVIFANINFSMGDVSIGEVSTRLGFLPNTFVDPNNQYTYWVQLIAIDGSSLERRQFSIDNQPQVVPPREGEVYDVYVEDDVLAYPLILPYYKNVKFIKLYSANLRLIDSRDISYLASTCGDGECQDHESFEDCPGDCLGDTRDDFCNEEMKVSDPDCVRIVEKVEKKVEKNEKAEDIKNISSYIFIAIFFLVFVMGIGLFVWRKK